MAPGSGQAWAGLSECSSATGVGSACGLSHRLGIPNERIRLVQGDTDQIPISGGHGNSRAIYMGGTAIWRASAEIIAKDTRIAAEALEAAEADLRFG